MSSFHKSTGLLKGAVAALALGAMMGMPAVTLAQSADAPESAQSATPAADVPQVIRDLNLSDLKVDKGRRGVARIQGKLADGAEFQGFADEKGALRGARMAKGQALPDAVTQQLVPEAVRTQEVFGQFARVSAVFGKDRAVMIAGRDAGDDLLRAVFAQDGTLLRYGRGEGVGPGMNKARMGHHGPSAHHDGAKPRTKAPQMRHQHDKRAGNVRLSEKAIQHILSGAGYTDLGKIDRSSRRALVDARNPQGEAVQVEISPRGDVIREIAK